MRKSGLDKMALLVVLGAALLVVAAAAGTAPAYSDDAGSQPVPANTAAPAELELELAGEAESAREPATETAQAVVVSADADGYEWSGSRPAGERYLWSHRAN